MKSSTNKKCYIHVGYGKTGTSYVQNCFRYLEGKKKLVNISYPLEHKGAFRFEQGIPGNAHNLASGVRRLEGISDTKKIRDLVNNLFKNVQSKNRDVFLSSEDFSLVDEKKFKLIQKYIAELGYDVELIITVRSMYQFTYSFYQQNVSSMAETKTFLECAPGQLMTHPLFLFKLLSHLEMPAHVVSYHSDNLLREFYDILGEPYSSMELIPSQSVNRSLTPGELEGLLEVNRLYKDAELARYISSHLKMDHPGLASGAASPEEIEYIERNLTQIRPQYEKLTNNVQNAIKNILFLKDVKPKKTANVKDCNREDFFAEKERVYLLALGKIQDDYAKDRQRVINKDKIINHKDHVIDKLNKKISKMKGR